MPIYKCRFCSGHFQATAGPAGYVWCFDCGGVGDDSDLVDAPGARGADTFVPHRWEFAPSRGPA